MTISAIYRAVNRHYSRITAKSNPNYITVIMKCYSKFSIEYTIKNFGYVLIAHAFQCFACVLTVLRIFRHRCRHSAMPRQTRHQGNIGYI